MKQAPAIKHDELKASWEFSATPLARHHCSGLDDWADFVDGTLFSRIQQGDHVSALEWGCGSGDISLRLARRDFEIHAVDILEDSLDRTEIRLTTEGHNLATRTCIKDLAAPNLAVSNIDCLVSVAVVQHFPSYDYWQKVAKIWRSLEPKTIVLQTRHSDVLKQPKDYSTDYLFSLWMPTEAVLSQFPSYDVTFHQIDQKSSYMWSGNASYEFFVLEKRELAA